MWVPPEVATTPPKQFSPLCSKNAQPKGKIVPGCSKFILFPHVSGKNQTYHLPRESNVSFRSWEVGVVKSCDFKIGLFWKYLKWCTLNFVCTLESSFSNTNFAYILLHTKWQYLSFREHAHIMTSVCEVIHQWLILILVSMERGCPYLYTGSKLRVILPSVLIIWKGVATTPIGKYVWENPQENKG